jgi:hypothetical protein
MDLIEIVMMNREKKVEVALRPEATLTYFKVALRSLHRSLTTEHTLTETTTPQAKKKGRGGNLSTSTPPSTTSKLDSALVTTVDLNAHLNIPEDSTTQ